MKLTPGKLKGMKAVSDSRGDLVDQVVFDVAVAFVPPPNQYIRAAEQFVADPLVRVIETGLDHLPAAGFEWGQSLCNRSIDILRINLLRDRVDIGRPFGPDHHFSFVAGGQEGRCAKKSCRGRRGHGDRAATRQNALPLLLVAEFGPRSWVWIHWAMLEC